MQPFLWQILMFPFLFPWQPSILRLAVRLKAPPQHAWFSQFRPTDVDCLLCRDMLSPVLSVSWIAASESDFTYLQIKKWSGIKSSKDLIRYDLRGR